MSTETIQPLPGRRAVYPIESERQDGQQTPAPVKPKIPPWLKKNPFPSAWLSTANAAVGQVRGRATAQAKRQVTAAVTKATEDAVAMWMAPLKATPKGRVKRRTRK